MYLTKLLSNHFFLYEIHIIDSGFLVGIQSGSQLGLLTRATLAGLHFPGGVGLQTRNRAEPGLVISILPLPLAT